LTFTATRDRTRTWIFTTAGDRFRLGLGFRFGFWLRFRNGYTYAFKFVIILRVGFS
jgi:hypothetical protein